MGTTERVFSSGLPRWKGGNYKANEQCCALIFEFQVFITFAQFAANCFNVRQRHQKIPKESFFET